MFTRQIDRTQQLLNSFLWKPLAPTHLFSTLEAELNSLNSIHTSYQPLILEATQLLKKKSSFNEVLVSKKHMRRSLLPFLGDALSWLIGTATTKDVNIIKTRINQLIATQPTGDPSPCHLYPQCHQICHPGEQATHQYSNEYSRKNASGCHNTIQHHTLPIQWLELPADCTPHPLHPGKPLRFSLYYMREVPIHIMDYIDAATTGILSPHVLPIEDLGEMQSHIEETLPSTVHLPIASKDALHFYRYLCTHVLIADDQFLLLISVPVQDHAQQLEIYEVFYLAKSYGNFSVQYSIHNRYLGIMHYDTKAVEISEDQLKTYQKGNRQFCSLNTPFLPLANPPTCVSALYAKDKASIQKKCSLEIKKASNVSIPTSITPNAWIITSPPTTVPSGITLICPGEAPRSVIPQTPIHIL